MLRPGRTVGTFPHGQCVVISSYWGRWPLMFPQHGPGKKHLRKIALEPWQAVIVSHHADRFVRGCLDSDGSRHRRVVRGKDYPAYNFTNFSADIRGLFCRACDRVGIRYSQSNAVKISIARRGDVAKLDAIMGIRGEAACPAPAHK